MFWHPELRLLLTIYVDDFKMAGPKGNMVAGWALLREVIDMGDPAPTALYLGCEQSQQAVTMPSVAQVQVVTYDNTQGRKVLGTKFCYHGYVLTFTRGCDA